MTDQLDYTGWTWQQHATAACELAAKADELGGNLIQSMASQRVADVQQITSRALVHIGLAKLKKGESAPDVQPESVAVAAVAPEPEAETATTDTAAPATTRTTRRSNRSRGA